MNRQRIAAAAALTLGLLALSAAPAEAAPARHHHHHCGGVRQVSGDSHGILNGTQIYAPVNVDLDLSHNALGLLGGNAAVYDRHHEHRC